MRGRSFYYCIAENCLPDAIKCLENAKGNDSIAYLRFWFRDPRQDDRPQPEDESDEEMIGTDAGISNGEAGTDFERSRTGSETQGDSSTVGRKRTADSMDIDQGMKHDSRTSSNDSTATGDTHEAIFGQAMSTDSSASSIAPSPESERNAVEPIELEAVISCASDGLVVCMRKARPMIPHPTHRPSKPVYANGLFAAPWASEPMLPTFQARGAAGFVGAPFAPSLGPKGAQHANANLARAATGPDSSDFMNAIRDQAVFAWGLTAINGSLADFGQGKPLGESIPKDGLPVWASDPRQPIKDDRYEPNMNGMYGTTSRSPDSSRSSAHIFGDPGLDRYRSNGTRSTSVTNGSSSNGNSHPGSR